MPTPAANCAYAMRVRAEANAQSVVGCKENASKTVVIVRCLDEKRKAKEKRSTACLMSNPPLLKGRGEGRIWRDPPK